ncbi:MAG: peptide deformylase [Chlamydiales bacterium]|nr:peptide deformylase [Chlamydiales bacterium]
MIVLGCAAMVFGNSSLYVSPQDPILKSVSSEVPLEEIPTTKIQGIIDLMLELSIVERNKGYMVGLAAPQIGIPLQIILVDTLISPEQKDFSHPLDVFINPKITWISDEIEEYREGCYSTGTLSGKVPRSKQIRLEAYNRFGEMVELEAEGYNARIFQHEVDHLNGLRFPDRMTNFNNLHWVEEDEIEEYRANYESWPKKCSKEDWLAYIHSSPADS